MFESSVIAQVGGHISSAEVIRWLPKSTCGVYVSANNSYSYISVFIGLGLFTVLFRKKEEEKKSPIL